MGFHHPGDGTPIVSAAKEAMHDDERLTRAVYFVD